MKKFLLTGFLAISLTASGFSKEHSEVCRRNSIYSRYSSGWTEICTFISHKVIHDIYSKRNETEDVKISDDSLVKIIYKNPEKEFAKLKKKK